MRETSSIDTELQYMYSLERFGIKLGLARMKGLMEALDGPHEAFSSVHLTGTNGKGSTASFIAQCLSAQGLKVGLYTSPHLLRFNERICIDGVPILDERLAELVAHVRQCVAGRGLNEITFFEFTTAVALVYFAHEQVDIAVVEVGMGGEFDATNVLVPLVSVITNVGLDHVPMLGKDRHEIAATKAGIIKNRVPVVLGEQDTSLRELFAQVCQKKQATLHQVSQLLQVDVLQSDLEGQSFRTRGAWQQEWHIQLLGRHQLQNAATALATLWVLQEQGVGVSAEARVRGLATATWPGRLQIISRRPFILVDGAHNDDGVRALEAFLQEQPGLPRGDVLVLAMKQDKDVGEMAARIVPRFRCVIVTEGNYDPADAEQLAAVLARQHPHVEAIKNVAQAAARARSYQASDGMMLVTGSLYMIGGAMAALQEQLSYIHAPA